MKKSRRLIRNTLLVLGATVVLYVAASRWHAVDTVEPAPRPAPTPAELAVLRDFNSIVVAGNLAVEIVQQPGYSVEFIPVAGSGSLSAAVHDHALALTGIGNTTGDRVRIGMPELTQVFAGAIPILSISGFSGNNLMLKLDGSPKLIARNNAVLKWRVIASGSAGLQFDRASINAGRVDVVGRATFSVVD